MKNSKNSLAKKLLTHQNRFLIGLVIALSFSLYAFEYTSVRYEVNEQIETPNFIDDGLILPPITYRTEKLEQPKPKIKPSPIYVIVPNTEPTPPEKELTVIEDPSIDIPPFDPSLYGQTTEVIVEEEAPYYSAEFFAHYDNCAGLSSDEMYQCALKDIINRIQSNFEIPRRLKEESGEFITYVSFMVRKTGEISDIKIERSNHPLMGKAAVDAVRKLPDMKPAMQKGKAVNLILRVPIKLEIQGYKNGRGFKKSCPIFGQKNNMLVQLPPFAQKSYQVDLSKGIDLSIPLRSGVENVNAWYVNPVSIEPVQTDQFTGSVKLGGSVNFRNIAFNPHGNGTHTECVGHISVEEYSINQCLTKFFFFAELISIQPKELPNGDSLIDLDQIKNFNWEDAIEALIIRTLPNELTKKNRQYSNSNPPYLSSEAMQFVADRGIKHFLIDLPSVDRELDNGKLAAHHIFWDYPAAPKLDCTISELLYIPDELVDGTYFLNLQIASFENDASPSKPVVFPLIPFN